MRALYLDEIAEWCRERGIEPGEEWELPENPELPLTDVQRYRFDTEGILRTNALVEMCLNALGTWDECLLWVRVTGVFPSWEDWPAFYALRGADRERRSLDDTPGHLFAWSDRSRFSEYLALIIGSLWDAVLLPVTEGQPEMLRIATSHDAFLDLWSRTFQTFLPTA